MTQIIQTINETVETLGAMINLWKTFIPEGQVPPTTQFDYWISTHTIETLNYAIRATARKRDTLNGNMTLEWMIRYCSSVANNRKRSIKTDRKN